MLVSHQHDYDTHAVVGGREVMEFGIAQTAEFFTVLSSTLYTDKKLAVIREVLCNAWDAHIASDRTDQAVEVSIKDGQLVIRDFGHGIHPSKMHPIYCIYGASTKVNDGKQTGGFGLGSKAPFAYSDHFTVTSCHAGTKTVYAISRGSALTEGRPDLRVMVRVPSHEEGIEVAIPLADNHDSDIFSGLVERVASQGEMFVRLNGQPISKLPLSQAQENIFLTSRHFQEYENSIFIRYGNVVYPVPPHIDYQERFSKLNHILQGMNDGYRNNTNWKAILQAPSNTITVTPSRESLSLTETTINTLRSMLQEVIDALDWQRPQFKQEQERLLDEKIDECYRSNRPDKLLVKGNLAFEGYQGAKYVTSPAEYAKYRIRRMSDYDAGERFHTKYLEALIQGGYRRRHDLVTYAKQLALGYAKATPFHQWFSRPLLKKLAVHAVLKTDRLLVSGLRLQQNYPMLKKLPELNRKSEMALLSAVVILTYSKKAMVDYSHDIFRSDVPRLVYVVPRGQNKHRLEAIAFFQKLDFHVVDFTRQIEADEAKYPKLAPQPRVKKVVTGLPALTSLLDEHGFFRANRHLELMRRGPLDSSITVVKPLCVFQPESLSSSLPEFFSFGDNDRDGNSVAKDVVKLIGTEAGIVINKIQYQKWIDRGARPGNDYLAELVCKEVLSNPQIKAHLVVSTLHDEMAERFKHLLNIAKHCPNLTQKLGLPPTLNERDNRLLRVFRKLVNRSSIHSAIDWSALVATTNAGLMKNALPDNHPLQLLIAKLVHDRAWMGLDLEKISNIVSDNANSNYRDFFEDIILKTHSI